VAALCAVLTVFSGTATKAALCAALIFHTASKSLEVGQAQLEGANFVLATYIIGSVMGPVLIQFEHPRVVPYLCACAFAWMHVRMRLDSQPPLSQFHTTNNYRVTTETSCPSTYNLAIH